MSNTLTEIITQSENHFIDSVNPKGSTGFSWLGRKVVYHTVPPFFEFIKITTILTGTLKAMIMAKAAMFTCGLNAPLFKGISQELKQGNWLIPTIILTSAKFFSPTLTIPSNQGSENHPLNYSKRLRIKGKKYCIEILKNPNPSWRDGLIARAVFVGTYLASVVLRIGQTVLGILSLLRSLIRQNRKEIEQTFTILNVGGFYSDLFKMIMRGLNPRCGLVLEKREMRSIEKEVADVLTFIANEHCELSKKHTVAFEEISRYLSLHAKNIKELANSIQNAVMVTLRRTDAEGKALPGVNLSELISECFFSYPENV